MVLVFIHHRTRLEQERQKELQDANRRLRQSEAELEQRVEQRTQELAAAKQETEAALEKAIEADNLKSQFLASMSHELRTPLSSILTFTELMEMGTFGDVSAEQKDFLGKIFFSGKHLLSLINDVLDITKIQSGMLTLFIEDDFNVHKELDMVVTTARNLLDEKPVTLVSDIDPGLPQLRCDKRRIRQVLLNLTSNAVKFTEKGTITVSAKQRGDDILFAVIDTGPGIDAEHQAVIFEPFIQTEAGIKHAGGTGLGLPISKKLIEAHGGKIQMESTLGEGSAFFVRMPMRQPEAAVAVSPRQ
jgi:signal transduction histidine kinase